MEILDKLRSEYLTQSKFNMLRYAMVFTTLAWLGISLYIWKNRNIVSDQIGMIKMVCSNWNARVLNAIGSLNRWQKSVFWTILLLAFFKALYYVIVTNMQYDEYWSYNYFTANSFIYSIAVFSPHPLFHLSTNFFEWMPFPTQVNFRLPALLAGAIAIVIAFAGFRKYFGPWTALTGMALLAFAPPLSMYMIYGRGYSLVILFTILSLLFMIEIAKGNLQKRYYFGFALTSILGLYSSQVFIFPLITLLVFGIGRAMFSARFQTIRNLIISSVLIIAGFLIIYLPVLLTTGFKPMFQKFGNAGSWSIDQLWTKLALYAHWFTGGEWGWIFLVLGLAVLIYLALARMKAKAFLVVIAVTIPVLSMIIFQFYPEERILSYLIVFFVLGILVMLDRLGSPGLKALLIGLIIAGGTILTHNHYFFNWSKEYDNTAKNLIRFIVKYDIHSCYVLHEYYIPALEFHAKQKEFELELITNNPNSVRYQPFESSNVYHVLVDTRQELPFREQNYRLKERIKEGDIALYSGPIRTE